MAINLSGLSLASDGAGGGGGVTAKMKFIPVTTLPNADEAKKTAVYLVPAKNATSKNKYDEYVVLQTENGYIWELFGQDVSVDLQSFATKADLNKKQDKLVNQQNIRSINGVPLVGAGNINFEVFATAAEHKKVTDFVDKAPDTYVGKDVAMVCKDITSFSQNNFIGERVHSVKIVQGETEFASRSMNYGGGYIVFDLSPSDEQTIYEVFDSSYRFRGMILVGVGASHSAYPTGVDGMFAVGSDEYNRIYDMVRAAVPSVQIEELGKKPNGVQTVNGAEPDENGNINLNVMTDEQKQIVDNATQQLTALDQKVDDLTKVGSEKTYTFSEAFTIAGKVNSDGTWNTKQYQTAFHTDYIDITKFESIIGKGLWNNTNYTWPAAFYDENKVFLYGLTGSSVDASKASNPTAKYVVFQCEIGKTFGIYAVVNTDGVIPALSKQLGNKADKDNVPTTEEFNKVKGDVEEIVGYEDRDITNSITWVNGRYGAKDNPLTSVPTGYNNNISWASGKCAEIDVTNYDKIAYKNAISELDYVRVGYLIGDGELLLTITGNTNNGAHFDNEGAIDLTEYKSYSTLILKINGSQVQEKYPTMQDVVITATKNGIRKDDKKVAKKIVLNGDSLCNRLGVQLMRICHSQGYELLNRSKGGENIIGNLTRAGGMTARVSREFTMPASGDVTVDLTSSWLYEDGTYAQTPYNNPNPSRDVWIKGVKGVLTQPSTDITCLIVYNSSKVKIATYNTDGERILPSSAAYIRFNVRNDSGGVPHVLVDNVAIDTSSANIEGYVNSSDAVVSNADYKHTDYIPVTPSSTLYFDALAAPSNYVFTRSESGTSFLVGKGTECFDNRLITDKALVHIWFSGQNGGYKTKEEYVEMTAAAAQNFNTDFVVMSTHTQVCNNKMVRASRSRFGAKYLNIREYLAGNAIYDALRWGLITDTSLTPEDWEATMLDSAKVHQNDVCAYIEAVQVWNKMIDLGYVVGDRIDDADLFIKAGNQELDYWYNVPEDGYGVNWPFTE